MINIVVFASGSGTNFQSIINATENEKINGRICGLITNKTCVEAIERAKRHHISHITIKPSDYSVSSNYHNALLQQLDEWDADLIVLAGYMLKIPHAVIKAYKNRIVNIHPSLLPKYGGKGYYGMKVHQAVIANKEQQSGCTVHFVTEEYDAGPIIDQRTVPVYNSDDASSLARRVLKKEHELFPEVIAKLANELNLKNNP